jgi:sterol desaturase/sphingolipid hydroxylase (fatty acid hydroxylase superfamily)
MTGAQVSAVGLLVTVAAAGALAPVLVLHVALAHAMRARGHRRWRVRDTALVSPLLVGGLFVAFGALGRALAAAAAAGAGAPPAGWLAAGWVPAGWLLAAVGGFVVAGFGARAVGKLY